MIKGAQVPFQKKLILRAGFKSKLNPLGKAKNLFRLGFSHPVIVPIPENITATAEKNVITITGIDKELVGSFAVAIRALKKPELYKGKGIRCEGEAVRRKQGKMRQCFSSREPSTV